MQEIVGKMLVDSPSRLNSIVRAGGLLRCLK